MISIVIPTYSNAKGFQSCVESILENSTLDDYEIVVVANGAPQETRETIFALEHRARVQSKWFDEPIGMTRATNEGIKLAKGDFIVVLNDDTVILGPEWLKLLQEPFADATVGVTGPQKEHDPNSNHDFLIFFCVMIRRDVFARIGILDEVFNPGFGEDTDFCIRAERAGFKVVTVPSEEGHFLADHPNSSDLPEWKKQKMWVGQFPIYHDGEQTFSKLKDTDSILERNRKILHDRYASPYNIDYAVRIDGWMAEEELRWLAKKATEHKTVIEVGSWHGRSSRAIADNLPANGKLYCVDTWGGSSGEPDAHGSAKQKEGDNAFIYFNKHMSEHLLTGKVRAIRMTSTNGAELLKDLAIQADMIFIDADHNYENVKADIESYLPLLAPGGLICGHDYSEEQLVWVGVKQAVNERFPNVSRAPKTSIWYVDPKKLAPVRKREVYDCFVFFNELDLLEMRLTELDGVVDHFVVVEGVKTHSNQPKLLYFKENAERFARWKDRIIHVVVDDYPEFTNAWDNERHQRDSILKGLVGCQDDDIIIISDVDEIPRAHMVETYNPKTGIGFVEQDLYYYFLDCQCTHKWNWLRILPWKLMKGMTPCQVRYFPATENIIPNGGWHFSFMGGVDRIIDKVKAYAHQEYNTPDFLDPKRLLEKVRAGEDIFGRDEHYKIVPVDDSFPGYVRSHKAELAGKGYIAGLTKRTVTAEISTKDRYFTTLPMAVMSVVNQTRKPDRLVIFDDGEQKDLREVSPYKALLQMCQDAGIAWEVQATPRMGQVANHQHMLDTAQTDFVWRLDDDNVAEPTCLAKLLESMEDPKVGAVGGLVFHPGAVQPLPRFVTAKMEDIFTGLNMQWFQWNGGPREAEHLYSTFLYRVEAGKAAGGYQKNLSPVGHREETIFTHSIQRAGYKLLVNPGAKTWHLRESSGGIRSYKEGGHWDHDELIFREKLSEWRIAVRAKKVIVLDCGLGDHWAFKSVWPEIKERYKDGDVILAVCFPELFPGENLISIADAKLLLGDKFDQTNIYKWMWDNGWNKSLPEAWREFLK